MFSGNTAIYREMLEPFILPSADKLYKEAKSFSSRTRHLPTLLKAAPMTMVLLALSASKLD